MARRIRLVSLAGFVLATVIGTVPPSAVAAPNPVALTEVDYQALGRVFSDPQGCQNNPPAVPPAGVSPYAKGNACFGQFLHYEETILGAQFLEQRFPEYLDVIKLDEAYDNQDYRSAGLPQEFGQDEDGNPVVLARDRKPLYLFKVTDSTSPIPESERAHFAYTLSIHGIERAGVEGGIRAMEDLVTWAACENPTYTTPPATVPPTLPPPACNPARADTYEGPFPRPIVETAPPGPRNPMAGDVLEQSVIYFATPNPDGWERGEVGEGDPGFQRYNGNGMDLNRDWPTIGYTYRPYSPGSEPETQAYGEVFTSIRDTIASGKFTGGIDLHGQLTANAYSYTLLGSGQRDYRKNFSTVDQALRTWSDQSQRLAWSPYITNGPAQPGPDHPGVFPQADQWGTVIDTLGYQITGGVGDWMDSPLGLDAVGIDNEMSLSHIAPNTGYDPTNEQMHVDGNKGLIYSQIASMLTEEDSDYRYDPVGKIGYVFNPKRISHPGDPAPQNPGYPAQNDIDALLPCAGATCDGGTFVQEGSTYNLEFDVRGPDSGIFNGGITATATFLNANGISLGSASRLQLQRFGEESGGEWETVASAFVQGGSPDAYLQGGQIVTANHPVPGLWRVRLTNAGTAAARVEVDFNPHEAEAGSGQRPFSASSMDFFEDLNEYIDNPAEHVEPVSVEQVIEDPASLEEFDSLVVANDPLPAYTNAAGDPLGLTNGERNAYYGNLRFFANGGGNLVLTDGAFNALPRMGIVPEDAIRSRRVLAGRYQFNVPGRGNTCPTWDPSSPPATHPDPLTEAVCLPGTAGGTSRQSVEPTPLGYTPDTGLDGANEARMLEWSIERTAWETGCGKSNDDECTAALVGATNPTPGSGLGERHVGSGVMRIAGTMFPDPNYAPGGPRDMRFGVLSYSLAFSTWQVFLNLVDYERPVLAPGDIDLAITKTDSPDPVQVNDDLTYQIVVSNGSLQAATGVTVVDELPNGVEFKSATSDQGPCTYDETTHDVTCDIGGLGGPATVDIVVVPTEVPDGGQITNTARVTGNENDPTTPNVATTETTVEPAEADLSIVKTDSPDPVKVGQELTYDITVTNQGPDNATAVTVTDDLPDTVEFVSASTGCAHVAGTVTCNLGSIADGAEKSVEIVVRPETPGAISNSATVDSPETDEDETDDSDLEATTVDPLQTDLSVEKSDSPDPVAVGGTLEYTVVVRNSGGDDATGVEMTDELPPSVRFVAATSTRGTCLHTAGVVRCDIGDLGSGQEARIAIVVIPTSVETITNTARVRGNDSGVEADPTASNDSDTEQTNVLPLCPGYEEVDGNHVVGTAQAEVLRGTGGRDVVCGLGGDDTIRGLGGNDLLVGNAGDDVIRGGPGNDRIPSGHGADRVFGGAGNDKITSGAGVDRLSGQKGNDRLRGGYEDDILRGGPGKDRLAGVWRHDLLNGGGGSDRCKGGRGSDRLVNCERGRE